MLSISELETFFFLFNTKMEKYNFPITFNMLAVGSEMLAAEIRMGTFTFDKDSLPS